MCARCCSRDAALDGNGLDSLFLPGTPCFERSRVGNSRFSQNSDRLVRVHTPTACVLSAPVLSHMHRAQDTSRLPQNMLDYRCHVPGGAIGHDFPPKVRAQPSLAETFRPSPFPHTHAHGAHACTLCSQFAACLAAIAARTPQEIYERYGFPRGLRGKLYDGTPADMAERLRAQAQNLLENGARGHGTDGGSSC
jgi:hypothetical protein